MLRLRHTISIVCSQLQLLVASLSVRAALAATVYYTYILLFTCLLTLFNRSSTHTPATAAEAPFYARMTFKLC